MQRVNISIVFRGNSLYLKAFSQFGSVEFYFISDHFYDWIFNSGGYEADQGSRSTGLLLGCRRLVGIPLGSCKQQIVEIA